MPPTGCRTPTGVLRRCRFTPSLRSADRSGWGAKTFYYDGVGNRTQEITTVGTTTTDTYGTTASSNRLVNVTRGGTTIITSNPSSTGLARTRSTLVTLVSSALQIAASGQPSPASPRPALSRIRAFRMVLAGALPEPCPSRSDRSVWSARRTPA